MDAPVTPEDEEFFQFFVREEEKAATLEEEEDKNLLDFVDNLGQEEEEEEEEDVYTGQIPNTNITDKCRVKKEEESNIWVDVADALNNWTRRILDAESQHHKSSSFRQNIEEALHRQQLDGLLNHQDITELRYVADLWTNLLNATSCYTVGCVFVKRDIITVLLELYTLKQISSSLFIESCLQL